MTDHSYRGGASRVTSAPEGRTSFGPDGVRGRVVGGFGRLVDRLEANIHRAPADMQPAAQKAVEVARARPLLTMAGLAIGALVLARGASRR